MKIVALGANLNSRYGAPPQTLYAALTALAERGIMPTLVSRIWRTAPVPLAEGVPWYHNAVAGVDTDLGPEALLAALLDIEAEFGRVRIERNEPRILDLDLIAYDSVVLSGAVLTLPHPRMQERAFVLKPMADILDDWKHPQTGAHLRDLIARLPQEQAAEPVDNGWDPV